MLGLMTSGGMELKGAFQVAPPSTNVKRAIKSVGQVVDRGNTITFDKHGGCIRNNKSGNEIPIYRSNGVFKMKAELTDPDAARRHIMAVETGGTGDELRAECQNAKAVPQPERPSPEEVATHELTHLPYRSWCAHCVRGRGRADDHHHVMEPREIPLVSIDYLFLGDEGEDKLTVLSVYDSATGTTFAIPVPMKGTNHPYPSAPLPGASWTWATGSCDSGPTKSQPFWP
jgi:hypothetical protein